MADSRAAKILSPAHRETALCRVLPFVKKKQPSAMQSGMQPCTSCTVWVSAPAAQGSPPPYLLACLPACLPHWPWLTFCKSGGHQVSGAEPSESLKVLDGHEPADI